MQFIQIAQSTKSYKMQKCTKELLWLLISQDSWISKFRIKGSNKLLIFLVLQTECKSLELVCKTLRAKILCYIFFFCSWSFLVFFEKSILTHIDLNISNKLHRNTFLVEIMFKFVFCTIGCVILQMCVLTQTHTNQWILT